MSIINDSAAGNKPLLCDGAMGTALIAAGFPVSTCLEALNISEPRLIQSIHEHFMAAGARLILTNTFGAQRCRLQKYGLEDRLAEYIQSAVSHAHAAKRNFLQMQTAEDKSRDPLLIFGDIGPSGLGVKEILSNQAQLSADFRATASHLLASGVDGLWLETFTSMAEVNIALQALADMTMPSIPLIVMLSPQVDGRLADGAPADQWVMELAQLPVTAVGLNCVAPDVMSMGLLQRLQNICHKPLAFKPHAGLPMSPLSPEAFALHLKTCLEGARVRWVGGCCGATAGHIRSVADVLTRAQSLL